MFYDPMLAKIISYAPVRRQAAGLLADALARTRIHGVRTNRDLLVNVLRHPAFLDGATDTAFFDTHGLAELPAPGDQRQSLVGVGRRAGGCHREPPGPQRFSPPRRAGGAMSCRVSRQRVGATVRARLTRSATASPASASNCPTSTP